MNELKELQAALQQAGHYAALVDEKIYTNSMKTIYIDALGRFIVQDDQTGVRKPFESPAEIYLHLINTGDTTTMKVVAGEMTLEEARLVEINKAAIRRIDDWEFLLNQAHKFNQYKKKTAPLFEEIERLRKALEFYADPNSYETNVVDQWAPFVPIDNDAGKIARNTLEGGE